MGPGVKHGLQRALKVRNLRAETALTKAQSAYLDHGGAYEPKERLRDMDILIQRAGGYVTTLVAGRAIKHHGEDTGARPDAAVADDASWTKLTAMSPQV